MRVRATAFGEYHGKRKPGAEFDFEGKPSGKWMEPVDDAARAAFKKAGIKVISKPVPPPQGEEKTNAAGDVLKPAPGTEPPPTGGSTGDKNVI